MQARPSRYKAGASGHEAVTNLVTNAYRLVATKSSLKIYEYLLDIRPSQTCKDLPAKVLGRAYVSRSIRKLLMNSILPQITLSKFPAGSILIEPNLEFIYSTRRFSNDPSAQENEEFAFQDLIVETDLLANLNIDVRIKYSNCFTSNPIAFGSTLLTAILHHQLQIDMLKYGSVYYMMQNETSGGAGHQIYTPHHHQHHRPHHSASMQPYSSIAPSYNRETRRDLISQHLMGISISGARRLVDSNEALVVINCSHTYITKSYRLIDLLASFIAGKPVENVALLHRLNDPIQDVRRCQIKEIAYITGKEEWFETFCSILNGFKCQANDCEQKHINLRFSLTEQSAIHTLVSDNITVQEYYKNLGINLNYPNLPCLKSRSNKHPFYPLEMCSLLQGQKVPIFRLSAAAKNHLAQINKPKPFCSKQSSSEAKEEIAQLNRDQFRTFGIQLSEAPVEASGKILRKPMLQYKYSQIEPDKDYWESDYFCQVIDLINNWCVIDTVNLNPELIHLFFNDFTGSAKRFGFNLGQPYLFKRLKHEILEQKDCMNSIIRECHHKTRGSLKLIMFIIDSSSTPLNRLVHLTFDEHPTLTATCIRAESIENRRQHRSIFRTLIHKLNARLGGTNVAYHGDTWHRLGLNASVDCGLMVVGLDVTHPDNELSGVSIVGCAYTYNRDLFKHRSLVWPQQARVEIINKMDTLMRRLLQEYQNENNGQLPAHLIIYRDGVSHEEFERVRNIEITKASAVINEICEQQKKPMHTHPKLSYIIAQKRHTMRFFKMEEPGNRVNNPYSGTLIHQGIVAPNDCEFYLYSNTSPTATARPLHYHVLVNGLGMESLQKLTYYLCFNFGKCSNSLSMPSSLRYAHNAAYDARNRVIASKEFQENKFYTTKFFC